MPSPRVENTYLVEHYRPGFGVGQLGRCVAQVRDQVQPPEPPGSPPRFACSGIVPADEAFLVVLRAESEHQVQQACLRAGATFDRISIAIADLTSVPTTRHER